MNNYSSQSNFVEVFKGNFLEEITRLSELLENFKEVSMDTEFPGTIYSKYTHPELEVYELMKKNVMETKMIQLGITLSDGSEHSQCFTWQFNLLFDLSKELHSKDSIEMLQNCGIDFEKNLKEGIDPLLLGDYILTSGLMLNSEINWITYQGLYDFAYLMKIVTNQNLSSSSDQFTAEMNLYFPNYYDLKLISENAGCAPGSLNRLSQNLGVTRVGIQHQAGSDALLTMNCSKKLKQLTSYSLSKNCLYNLDTGCSADESDLSYFRQNTYKPSNQQIPMNFYNFNYFNPAICNEMIYRSGGFPIFNHYAISKANFNESGRIQKGISKFNSIDSNNTQLLIKTRDSSNEHPSQNSMNLN